MIHVNVVLPERAMRLLEDIAAGVKTLLKGQNMAQQDLDALRAQVENNTDVVHSAVTLLDGLAAKLQAMADDPAEIRAFADQLQQNSADLAASITRNTPLDGNGGNSPTP